MVLGLTVVGILEQMIAQSYKKRAGLHGAKEHRRRCLCVLLVCVQLVAKDKHATG